MNITLSKLQKIIGTITGGIAIVGFTGTSIYMGLGIGGIKDSVARVDVKVDKVDSKVEKQTQEIKELQSSVAQIKLLIKYPNNTYENKQVQFIVSNNPSPWFNIGRSGM